MQVHVKESRNSCPVQVKAMYSRFIPERWLGSLRVYCKPMAVAVVAMGVDLRILISILFRRRGLLKIVII